MDPVSHAVTGGLLAQCVAKRHELLWASLIGAAAGMAPDLDILIRSAEDPLLNIQYHRHFTHALIMVPVIAGLVGLCFYPLLRKKLSYPRIYLFAFMGALQGGILDACTSYGTHLFWPFTDRREAWNIVAIMDPLYTLPLLGFLVFTLFRKNPAWARSGLIFALAYLSFGYLQMDRARNAGIELARQQGHEFHRMVAKPSIFNNVLFRVIYETDDHFHLNAVRVNWFGKITVYPGGNAPIFKVEEELNGLSPESSLYRDLQRFSFFSDDYLYRLPDNPDGLGDFRYSLLPNSQETLWAIRYDRNRPHEHVEFKVMRDVTEQKRETLRTMILGRKLD
jgi:inner membrane protein